ncbi:Hsp20/alpha crystallin family protein [Zestomonas carbonaria]|uniref:Spore protein SP21 n=1 Tax=Zestomonas carbonaria TaxID=2762745 RepID=A0A7U7I8H1_9GAMM|nr:Hsp20/alpha crystallin family protein [Pseudomonas carbonaria]CAD5105912.1 Spore protein SP21 [Pseudomonas carbonaria]
MSLSRWNPFREFEEFFNQYPRLLGKGGTGASQELMTATDWAPAVDISETPEAYLIKAELAGVKREDIQVKIEGGQLSLRGERRFEKEDKDSKQHRVERFYGSFSRVFSLPEDADEEQIKAEYKDGVLNLTLPKRAEAARRSRDVNIE